MAPRPQKEVIKSYQSRIGSSMKWREGERHEGLWKRMVDLYRGRHYAVDSPDHRMVINMAFATKNVIVPSISINNPKFIVYPRKPDSEDQAVVVEEIINYLWRTYKYQQEFRLAVEDYVVIGHGWLKVGYRMSKPPEEKKVGSGGNVEASPESGTDEYGIDDRPAVPGNVETELTNFDADRPFVERISPWDMLCDPHARHPKEMKWVAQRTRRRVADVKADERYNKKVREEAGATHWSRWSNDSKSDARDDSDAPSDDQTAFCDVIEFYDLQKNEMSTFLSMDSEGFLIKPAPIPYAFHNPFVMLRNYEVSDHFYPMGELEAIEALQLELNETRTQMLQHRQKFARKYLYHEPSFDERGLEGLQSDVDNEMVPFDGDIGDMPAAVVAMPVQGTPPDFYSQSEMIEQDINTVSGVSDYMRGDGADIRRTATEAAMIQDAMNSRSADKLAHIELKLAEIGEKLIMLMQQYMTGEAAVRIVGMRASHFVNFDADYIKGQFDFEVEAGSTQPRNESFRRQSALQFMDAVGPLVGVSALDPNMLARKLLMDFGVKDPSAFLGGQDPMNPEMQQGPPGMPGMPGEDVTPEGAPVPQGIPGPPQPPPEDTVGGIPNDIFGPMAGKSGLNL